MKYWAGLAGLLLATTIWADGPRDNQEDNVRPIPPKGIDLSPADRKEIQAALSQLEEAIARARQAQANNQKLLDLLPDVEIFSKAVGDALIHQEFFNPKELVIAKDLAGRGLARAKQLASGTAPWAQEAGLVVRGYRSRIDDSVQPYGLVVPESFQAKTPHRFRLDGWFHGRGETLSELSFINGRLRVIGEFAPPNTFVLHPYGRYCNANKLAGEIDFLEALEHAKAHYPIDEDRITVRGFSMGGAACWQFAVHYADRWAAAAPGAGFSETPDFLKVFQREQVKPTWYEQKLWQLYDCTDWALNLYHCPTVAYSGEIDRQKQAADMMAKSLEKEGIPLVHIIGPKTEHRYHPESKKEIETRISALASLGRKAVPEEIRFTTYTLRYPKMHWLQIDRLHEHWKKATLSASLRKPNQVVIAPANVDALTIRFGPGQFALTLGEPCMVSFPGQAPIAAGLPESDRSLVAHFLLQDSIWRLVDRPPIGQLAKRHGLQGPIDDAFMDRFLFVTPTGKSPHSLAQSWVASELEHSITHWRKQFRGVARVKSDKEVTEKDIADSNLVLWGDPESNSVLAQMADKLPVQWKADSFTIGPQSYGRGKHLPVLIYPNPLNPSRYVVVNSSFTYREYDYLNNARQVPKLPDWAVFDISTPRTSRSPAKVVDADFFDEAWQYKRSPERR